nr:ribonuclease H-like domain-containing protein [Tanacetum cinerariifolium]
MEPSDTFLIGDKVISTTPKRENDKFIKSSVNDLVPIPRESKVTSDSNLECSMPLDSTRSPRLDVLGERKVDIDLPFGEHLDTLSTGDREIEFNPRDIKTNDLIPVLWVFDEPLVGLDLSKLAIIYNHDGDQPKTSNPTPPIPLPTQQIPHIISSIKPPILKKGEYDIWAMKMEHYLSHTDYPVWQVIWNGNGPVSVTTDTNGMIKVLSPKTAEEVVAKERERKARTTLLMALPEDHLSKFHKIADAKEMWEAIKSRFSGNDESKKMQKYMLKQQFEGFSVSTSEGLDTLNFDDLYNNLSVFERDVKGTTASSSSNIQNVAFVFADNTSSTNDVSTAYSFSSPSVSKSQKKGPASYTDEVIHSFFANQSSAPQFDCDDLEQINDDDLEEMDLKWQVAMISMRIKKFHKRTGKKLQFDTRDTVGFDKTKVECFNCHKMRHFARDCRAKENQDNKRRDGGYNGNKARDNGRRPAYQDDLKALVTIDGEAIDWSGHVEEDTQNFATMAYSSSNSGSDNENVFMNKECDLENTPVNDRYAEGMHTVPPPMTRNYMPSRPDVEIDDSKFTYGPKQTSADESNSKPVEYASSDSDSRVETTNSMSAPVDNAPQIVCEPKTDSAPVYDTDESAEVHKNCDDNEIFNMFTQEEQYTELLEPIPESLQVPQNGNDVISEDTSVEQGGETVEQHPTKFEETRALYESLY